MSIPVTPPAGEVLRNVHAKSLLVRTVTVVATFFLTTAFALAGAPAAKAAPASANCDLSSGPPSSTAYSALRCTCPPGTVLISCIGGAPTCHVPAPSGAGPALTPKET